MDFYTCGINYKSVDIILREKYSLPESISDEILKKLKRMSILPIVILSTCNRTEFYFSEKSKKFVEVLKDFNYILDENFEKKGGVRAVEHLMRVASGLESQILGETEILLQVKRAYYKSLNLGLTNKIFNLIFNKTLRTAKDVRSKTKISYGNISFASIIFKKIKDLFGCAINKNILLLGTGSIAESVLNYFNKNEIKLKIVSGRYYEKAVQLANKLKDGVEVYHFHELPRLIMTADIIIVATSAPHFLITKENITKDERTRIIFDLAVPRNVDPDIKDENTIIYNIDDIKEISDKGFQIRKNSAVEAEKIIESQIEEIKKYAEFN